MNYWQQKAMFKRQKEKKEIHEWMKNTGITHLARTQLALFKLDEFKHKISKLPF